MIRVAVVNAKLTNLRLSKVRSLLDYKDNAELFKTIKLSEFQARALAYIRSITPTGKNTKILNSLGAKPRTRGEMALKDSWRVSRSTFINSIGFEINSILESSGQRGRAKIQSIEYGSKQGSYITSSRFKFFSTQREGWATIVPNREINRPPREGKHLTKKTSEYIESVLLPEIRASVQSTIRRRLEK